jgi:hypothetical protein
MRRILTLGLRLPILAAIIGAASACSVPVFRYALERWPADNFLAVVFHQGALTPSQAAAVRELQSLARADQAPANLVLRTVDLTQAPDPALLRVWQPLAATTKLPALVMLYPPTLGISRPAWQGPLTDVHAQRLIDSPARREIARRLLAGESAVWVLVESGDTKLDTPAAALLEARLRHLTSTLRLPELDPADVVGGATAASREKLKPAFSVIRLSRQNPAEEVLVQTLLHTEDDLAAARAPIVFPVFGRGRVLPALVGAGINAEMIDEAAVFLTGACSCVVKAQNPGSDLLFAVAWDRLVQPLIKTAEELPPLPGLAGFDPGAAAGRAPARPTAGPVTATTSPAVTPPAEDRSVTAPLIPGLLWVGGVAGGILLGATWWVLRRR